MDLLQRARLIPLSSEVTRAEISRIDLSTSDSAIAGGAALDLSALTPEERARVEEGELPSRWLMRWLVLCDAVSAQVADPLLCVWARKPGLLGGVQVTVEPLRADDLMLALCGPAKLGAGAVAVAWGIKPSDRAKMKAPTQCLGMVAPALDALGLVWAASESDLEVLGLSRVHPAGGDQ